jgi:sugar lactone lactonase YvrE
MSVAIERVGTQRHQVGEGPLWDSRINAWYWVDITARQLWRLDAASGATRSWSCDEMIACLALHGAGGVIAGMETGVFHLQPGDKLNAKLIAGTQDLQPGMRFNDGRCDRQGRFWSGTMWMDSVTSLREGALYRLSADLGLSQPIVDGLLVQNGLAWSPDGSTMYLSDSHPAVQQVWAYDYDISSGMPSRRRPFIDMRPLPGRPDGAAVDTDGCYWICGNDAGCILRFTPMGELDRRIDVPMAKPSMCSFGGAAMDELMVTSISAGQSPDDEWAGATLLLRPGAQGIPEAFFPPQ